LHQTNIKKLIESINAIRGELIKVVSEAGSYKEGFKKFMNMKHFGSFEQMRVEMELRYKA
jgi:hypothetical protein